MTDATPRIPNGKPPLVFDRRDRHVTVFHGPKAADVINGLVTNDVAALEPGTGCYAVALTAKGKIIADVLVLRRPDDVAVLVPASAFPGWWGMIRKYVNPRLSRYEDQSPQMAGYDLVGEGSSSSLAACGISTGTLTASYAHLSIKLGGAPCTVVRLPDYGQEAFGVLCPADSSTQVAIALESAGAVGGSANEREVLRVEAGRPRWGIDMDETTLAQEASMDELNAISYTKGCYTGQETVARLHFRGHVNKLLRGLTLGTSGVPSGTPLLRADGTPVGEVRSSVTSPRLGHIALGMVRREVEPGVAVVARWDGGETTATVVALPF